MNLLKAKNILLKCLILGNAKLLCEAFLALFRFSNFIQIDVKNALFLFPLAASLQHLDWFVLTEHVRKCCFEFENFTATDEPLKWEALILFLKYYAKLGERHFYFFITLSPFFILTKIVNKKCHFSSSNLNCQTFEAQIFLCLCDL